MKKEKNKLVITVVVSLILSSVIEMILVMSNTNTLSIERVLVLMSIISFVVLNFVIDRKKLYGYIVDNRFKIAGIVFVITTILGIGFVSINEESVILGKYSEYNNSKYRDFASTFYYTSEGVRQFLFVAFTNFKLLLAILISYELAHIISNDKMISAFASFIIAFSSYMLTELNLTIILGELVICLMYKYLNIGKESKKIKVIYGILFVAAMILYGFSFDLSMVIAFGYVILAMFITFVVTLKKENKLEKAHFYSALRLFLICIATIIMFHAIMLESGIEVLGTLDTTYNHMGKIMGYGVSVVETFKPIQNPEIWTSFISIFPMPIIIALVYMYKKENHFEFLLPLSIVMVLEVVGCSISLPNGISSLLGFAFVSKEIFAVVIALINVYLMIYIISNLKERAISFIASIYIPLIIITVYYFMERPVGMRSQMMYYWFVAIMVVPSLLIANYTDARYKKVFCFITVLLTLLSGITINPISNINYLSAEKDISVKEFSEEEKTQRIKDKVEEKYTNEEIENITKDFISRNIIENNIN